jgi:hypothetical protein
VSADSETEDAAAPEIDVVRGAPTDEELAAVLAVVSEAYLAEAEQAAAAPAARSRWEISARNLRSPLRRDLGWGGSAG